MAVRDIIHAAAGNTGNPNAWDVSKAYYDAGSDAWNISKAFYSYPGAVKSVLAQDDTPQDIFFKPDGTKMYIIGTPTSVHEYTLSIPWLVSSASFTRSLSVSAQESFPSGLFFKPDGTKMYICGASGDEVNEYDLSTPWDISTASALQNFSVSAQEINPTALFFKPDGTKMYLLGQTSDAVNEYSLSTAWDISTASYVQNFSVLTQEGTPQALSFKPDGTKMYVMGTLGDDINEYTLSTPWDISTATYVQVFYVGTQDNSPMGLYFKENGSGFYIVGSTSDTVYQYTIGGFSVVAQETFPSGVFFKPDGTAMYIIGSTGDDVNQYSLSTEWDVTTASYVRNFSVAAKDVVPGGLTFDPDGIYMYITGPNSSQVHQYTLSTAWDISTATFTRSFYAQATAGVQLTDVQFKSDGTKMYVLSDSNDRVYQYTLSTAWDISTSGSPTNYYIGSQELNATFLFLGKDGTKMYVGGVAQQTIYEYDLATAWDVTTASYLQTFSIKSQGDTPHGLFWKPDGTQFWVIDQRSDRVGSYLISPI